MKKASCSSDMTKTETMERDDLFYSESVVFKVESTLFSVPKSGIMQRGTFFETLLQDNRPNGSEFELIQEGASDNGTLCEQKLGSSDENPIVLKGVSKQEFRDFLRVVLPLHGVRPPNDDEQWLNILRLSHKWNFPTVKANAIDKLSHIFAAEDHDPIEAIVLCKKYDIKNKLIHSYEKVITHNSIIDREKMLKAGMDDHTINLLSALRDRWLTHCIWGLGQRFLGECGVCCVTHSLYCFKDTQEDQGKESQEDPFKTEAREFIEECLRKLEDMEGDEHLVENQGESEGDPEGKQYPGGVVECVQETGRREDLTLANQDPKKEDNEDDVVSVLRDGHLDQHSDEGNEDEDEDDDTEQEAGDEGEEKRTEARDGHEVDEASNSDEDIDNDDDDEEDEEVADEPSNSKTVLQELFDWFKANLKTPPRVKRAGMINQEDIFICVKQYVEADDMGIGLGDVANLLFRKALANPSFSYIHAYLCEDVAEDYEDVEIQDPSFHRAPISAARFFKRQLYRLCEEGFLARALDTEQHEFKLQAKKRRLALIKFMGELFMVDILYRRTMGSFVDAMLKNIEKSQDKLDIQSLCYLLALIGDSFDSGSAVHFTNRYFYRVRCLSEDHTIPDRLRDMLQEIVQFRQSHWKAGSEIVCKWLPSERKSQ